MLRFKNHSTVVFDPDIVRVLCGALDDGWQCVVANKATFNLGGDAEDARNSLAKHIVEIAKNGERDRQRLVERALEAHNRTCPRGKH